MATRGLAHRKPSSEDAYYHAVSQSPPAQDPIALHESPTGSSVLDLEEDDSVVEEIVMTATVGVTPAIRFVHFVLGCAVLLPWNGMSPRKR